MVGWSAFWGVFCACSGSMVASQATRCKWLGREIRKAWCGTGNVSI